MVLIRLFAGLAESCGYEAFKYRLSVVPGYFSISNCLPSVRRLRISETQFVFGSAHALSFLCVAHISDQPDGTGGIIREKQ